MSATERSVLHVLPHAGGGGDTYVDVLDDMPGYTFTRLYLAPKRKSGITARGVANVLRALRSHDLLHVHGEGAAALLLPALAARKSVVTLHGLHLLRRVTGLQRRLAELNLRAVVRAADRTICVSNAECDQLASVVGQAAVRRAVVVHNGAHLAPQASHAERARVRQEFGVDGSAPLAIWVGSLDERRDPFVVIRAALRTSTSLLVVGDGPLRSEVERASQAPVYVLGQRDDVPRLLAAADFFVLMSEREGLSFALLEAMAHGLPAIVADVAENLEAVGASGVAVPYGDEEATAAALRRFVEKGEERARLGKRAGQRIADLFTVDDMIARTRAVYDEVLASE